MGVRKELQSQRRAAVRRWRREETVDFKGKKLKKETHGSVTDPDAKLYRKGKTKEAKLCYLGHSLMENKSGLIVQTAVTIAGGTEERNAALTRSKSFRGQVGELFSAPTRATTPRRSFRISAP